MEPYGEGGQGPAWTVMPREKEILDSKKNVLVGKEVNKYKENSCDSLEERESFHPFL